jgi:hypothetical protein
MKILGLLTALALVTGNASAKVLIYRGTAKVASDTNTDFPASASVFLIIDPDQSTVSTLTLIRDAGKKLLNPVPPQDFRFAKAPISKGRTATIISSLSPSGGTNDTFENVVFRVQGTDKSLEFNSLIASNRVDFPRVISGLFIDDEAANGTGAFILGRLVVSYQSARSIRVNDTNLTSQQALDGLIAEFKGLGFE